MESSEVKRSTSPAASNEVDVADDDCSSKKPPKPEATQPPLNQEMERCPSGYRIPASVFESSTQGDWSVASNESLFSIHMGNMSFTNDYYTWRSGELGPPTSDHMFCYSEHSSTGGAADMRSRELGLAEATMLEVIKENEGRSPPRPLPAEVRNARRSAGSNHSNMSFAFSVAGGDTERIPSSTKSTAAAAVAAAAEAEAEAAEAENNAAEAEHDEAKEKEKGAQHRSNWLFCCPCWSFCS
ncbi:uncharacterized protein LOC131020324 [Salvia miltiorrhiza]|uniref:uncharacterized protein LOC131020324 n=1 Tax=Salvia miltiorrhiza TaxID=226208 RepID=UPI0025AD6567|nr:uncharacterized protein LOC131020324 [Salvia miltiorrhiza]XP_057805042.1 uncharacterized protein LOC131020324 [Salvia miltiorrhiza]